MSLLRRAFGLPKEATINGRTYRENDGYSIKVQTLAGEGYRGGRYSYRIPTRVTTVTRSGRLVIRKEDRDEWTGKKATLKY